MMRKKGVILVDFDGTLWKTNPFVLAFKNEYSRMVKKHGVNVDYMDFANLHRVLTRQGKLNVKGDLQKIYYEYHRIYIEPYIDVHWEEFYHFLYNAFLHHVKRTRFKPHSIRGLKTLMNDYYVVGLTNGHYDKEVNVINMKLGYYKEIMHNYYTPQKLFRKFNIKNPFKPELEIINSIINTHRADEYIMIGDHPKADGLLSRHSKLTVYLLTKHPNSIDKTIREVNFRKPTPEEEDLIRQLYYEGKIILVSSWKKLLSELNV